jgi:hypothetical protein
MRIEQLLWRGTQMKHTVVGVDKSVFQIHSVDPESGEIISK